jgi:dienelactone hydrolase
MFKILVILFLGFSLVGWSQGDKFIKEKKAQSSVKWDISKFVWSHSNPAQAKDDKPILDFNAIENWESIGPDKEFSVSLNTKYFAYTIKYPGIGDTLWVQSVDNRWKKPFANATPGFFSTDSKLYVFGKKDNLCLLQTGTETVNTIKDVVSYKQPGNNSGTWLAVQIKNSQTLILKNLVTSKEKYFENVVTYEFDYTGQWLTMQVVKGSKEKELVVYNLSKDRSLQYKDVLGYTFGGNGKVLALKTMIQLGEENRIQLQYISLQDASSSVVWTVPDEKSNLGACFFDDSGTQLGFVVETDQKITIWYWKRGMKKPTLKIDDWRELILPGYSLGRAFFSDNNRYILLTLEHRETSQPRTSGGIKIDVWSYRDTIIQSTQPYLLERPYNLQVYTVIAQVDGSLAFRLEKPFEERMEIIGDFALVVKSGKIVNGDRFWENDYNIDSVWLASLKDGSRSFLCTSTNARYQVWVSPQKKYIVYFDPSDGGNYLSYNINTQKLIKISMLRPAVQFKYQRSGEEDGDSRKENAGIACWLIGDSGILVYDNYDIWQLDLSGSKPPLNITNGYGRKNQLRFMLRGSGDKGQTDTDFGSIGLVIPRSTTLLLRSYNVVNKQNGLFLKHVGTVGDPEYLYAGQSMQGMLPVIVDDLANKVKRKTVGKTGWIIKQESAIQAPNYFYTNDFKDYRPLTNLQPQKRYNWLTVELHKFKQRDGVMTDGVLYKPENFDPSKKYPVIIAIYLHPSYKICVFSRPGYINCPISIQDDPTWMVSHGYLVFMPDIQLVKGRKGQSALNTVEGACDYLNTLLYVEKGKIGLTGHSFSGLLTYYVLTHSELFAAISVGAGSSDLISSSLTLNPAGQGFKESSRLAGRGENSMGNLWQNRDLWLAESPIMNADKVTAPYLIFQNKKDTGPDQGLEMFIALRRLGKKGWWLRYDDGGHVVFGNDAKDFTIRYTQFFDHYLKGAPAPRWMTEGIPFKLKGIDAKYELDITGSCGKDCQICRQ